MRNLITDYSFTADTRTIVLTKFDHIGIENIRLIVNETQKVVICSSMQKDNIDTISGNSITYVSTLPVLANGDMLTIEADMGTDIVYSGGEDWTIQKKIDALNPSLDKTWVLTKEMGEQLKPLAETTVSDTYFLYKYFYKSLCKHADLSSWTAIRGRQNAEWMFAESPYLESVDLSNVQFIQGDSFSSAFLKCPNLLHVDMSSLSDLGNGTRTLNCLFQECTTLQSVDLRSLRRAANSGYNPFNATFGGDISLYLIHIGIDSLCDSRDGYNPLSSALYVTELHVYDTPTDNVDVHWCPLSFDSVYGIITHIVDDPNSATGKTLTFKSGLSYQVTQSQKDDYDAAYNTLTTTLGWTVTNPPTVTVA